jgi:cytochrome c oxidase assembly factor CtaG
MLPIVPVAALAAVAAWHARSVRSARAAWHPARRLALGMSMALLLAGSLVALTYPKTDFTAYAVQQILLGLAAPLFFVLALPRLPTARVANSFLAWPAYLASLFVLYFTGFYGTSLHNPWVLQLVYVMWLGTGLWFYIPVVGRSTRYWPRVLYLLLGFPLWAVFGMALESQTTTIAHGVVLPDLHMGAAVLWVAGETVALLGAIAVFAQWLHDDERVARSHDQVNEEAAARQLALWRAARDAAARAS